MRAYFLTQPVRCSGTRVSHCPRSEMGTGGRGWFGSSGGDLEPKNSLSSSRSGKGVGCWESQTGTPRGMSRSPMAAWHGLSLGCLSWALGWTLHPSVSGLSQLVLRSPCYCPVVSCGASRLFSPAPRLPPAAKPLEVSRGDSHGSKPLPWSGGFLNNPAPFGAQQSQAARNPTLSSRWALGEAVGWWAMSPEPGCSPRDGDLDGGARSEWEDG